MSGFTRFHRALTFSGRMQFLSWLTVLFLSLSILVTNAVSSYLLAREDYSAGPRTESLETGLSFGSHRENSPLGKQRAHNDGAANGSSAAPEKDNTIVLALMTFWPMLQLRPDTASYPPYPATVFSSLQRQTPSTRAPPAMS